MIYSIDSRFQWESYIWSNDVSMRIWHMVQWYILTLCFNIVLTLGFNENLTYGPMIYSIDIMLRWQSYIKNTLDKTFNEVSTDGQILIGF